MKATLRKLTVDAMTAITLVCDEVEQIVQHHGLSHAGLDVGDDYIVGKWGSWQGSYWVYEIRTSIIHFCSSLVHVKEWIKLCREAYIEENAGRLNMEVTGLDFKITLKELDDSFKVVYGAQVVRKMDFTSAYAEFNNCVSHALALKNY